MKKSQRHNSQRGYFGYELYRQMKKNKNIWLITADLGYKMFDPHFRDFPDRCINVGAAEQAMVGIAVGLSYQGKIPFCYSITNFLLYRPFEWIRNYLAIGGANVKLIASGRDDDYAEDGVTHISYDAKKIMDVFNSSIVQHWPDDKEEVPALIEKAVNNNKPTFISLRR